MKLHKPVRTDYSYDDQWIETCTVCGAERVVKYKKKGRWFSFDLERPPYLEKQPYCSGKVEVNNVNS